MATLPSGSKYLYTLKYDIFLFQQLNNDSRKIIDPIQTRNQNGACIRVS